MFPDAKSDALKSRPVRAATTCYFGVPVQYWFWQAMLFAGLAWLLVSPSTFGAEALPARTNPPPTCKVEAATRTDLNQRTPLEKTRSDSYFEGGFPNIAIWS